MANGRSNLFSETRSRLRISLRDARWKDYPTNLALTNVTLTDEVINVAALFPSDCFGERVRGEPDQGCQVPEPATGHFWHEKRTKKDTSQNY